CKTGSLEYSSPRRRRKGEGRKETRRGGAEGKPSGGAVGRGEKYLATIGDGQGRWRRRSGNGGGIGRRPAPSGQARRDAESSRQSAADVVKSRSHDRSDVASRVGPAR
ncbi:unnamed protein product, partial [Musa textilis]